MLTIALPSRTDTEAWFRPLELVRAVVGNIFVALDAIFQESSPHLMLSVFELPSPLGASAKHSSEASKEDAKNAICSVVAKLLKEEDTSKGFAEFMRLLVTAEAYYRCGKSTMQAWAAASRDFDECTRGRKVALYNIYIYTLSIVHIGDSRAICRTCMCESVWYITTASNETTLEPHKIIRTFRQKNQTLIVKCL